MQATQNTSLNFPRRTWPSLWRETKRHLRSLPFVAEFRMTRYRRHYFDGGVGHPYFGYFHSFAAARDWLPRSDEFDTTLLADEYVNLRSQQVFAYDYPVIYWMDRAFRSGATRVLDVGGSVGVHFKAYRPYLKYPPSLAWHVIEVPAIVRLGTCLAWQEKLSALTFSDSLDAIEQPADIWLSCGALQYIEQGRIPRLLERTAYHPRWIILNKLPLYDGADFVTTQRLARHCYAPMHVYDRERFIAEIEACGYALDNRWDVPERSFFLPGHAGTSFDCFTGLAFSRR